MMDFIRRLFGAQIADKIGPPRGTTGNQWDEDDFREHDTPLAIQGGPEFVAFCIAQGTCKQGTVTQIKFLGKGVRNQSCKAREGPFRLLVPDR